MKLQSEIHRMIVMRDNKHTNFLEVDHRSSQFRNFKIIYKRYAGLYFALCVDINDNELTHLEVFGDPNAADPPIRGDYGPVLR